MNFDNNLQRWFFLKFEFLNYQTLIKAYKNMSYKRKRSFKRFWKKLWREKEKNPILVYPGLRYTHKKLNFACKFFFSKNVCLNTKINLRLKKKQKMFGGNFKNTFVVAIKQMLVIQFQKTKIKKKSKFSVVAAQKTLKCFASSWIDCWKAFFSQNFLKKNSNHTISIYRICMTSIFFIPFFSFFYE